MFPSPLLLLRAILNLLARNRHLTSILCLLACIEIVLHVRRFNIPHPPTPLDVPFYTKCQSPALHADSPRANATLLMLARNSDLPGALSSLQSLEAQFNHVYHYPIVFFNDEEWEDEFMEEMRAIWSGGVTFERTSRRRVGGDPRKDGMIVENIESDGGWGWPEWVDRARARREWERMETEGVLYAKKEGYHHMCRWNSGFFYDHPALKPYKWYWRVEPNVEFTCKITYDPFIEMQTHKKVYGYTVALWEIGKSVPSLFRKAAEYKAFHSIKTRPVWTALVNPSRLPWPLRRLSAALRNRDGNGDLWNMCHFWSNFEIADMDFFRGEEYRHFFSYLDLDGGFYYERWGDAPVHTLAAALFLEPAQLHHFADFGYRHEGIQYCPFAPHSDGTLPDPKLVKPEDWREAENASMGCDCVCNTTWPILAPVCLNLIRRTML